MGSFIVKDLGVRGLRGRALLVFGDKNGRLHKLFTRGEIPKMKGSSTLYLA
jgi:hypothetical protein